MVSNLRRKLRRYLLGATQKATGVWWIGRVTVRVMEAERAEASTRPVHVKAYHGAEKSRLTRRRKRGLRKNRDRGNADPIARQSLPKSQSQRAVNQAIRKAAWVAAASRRLLVDAKKLNKFPRGVLRNLELARVRRRKKLHCLAKWQRFSDHATKLGIPPQLGFHATFWDYLMIETDRGKTSEGWDFILAGLPRPLDQLEPVVPKGVSAYPPSAPIRRRGGYVVPVRACRMCGYVGREVHAWNSCRSARGGTGGQPRRGDGRRSRGRRGRRS
jgi:hypothetical protein